MYNPSFYLVGFTHFDITGDETWDDYTVELDIKPLIKHGTGSIIIATRIKGNFGIPCRINDRVVIKNGNLDHNERITCDYGQMHNGLSVSSREKLATTWGNLKQF